MYEQLLESSGLTKNESLAYLSLLKLGKAKSGEIVRDSKISGGKIYETLYKLVDKGLVKYITENNIKFFIANHPKTIIEYVKERERSLQSIEKDLGSIVPDLENIRKLDSRAETVSLIKGLRGVSTIVYDALEKAQDISIMGVRSGKNIKFNNFWKKWHRHRVALKKKAKIIFSDKNTDYWRHFKKQKYTKVREILHFSPGALMIIDNNSFIFSYDKELICIHITSESIANSFKGFFNGLWDFAKIK